MSERIPVSGPCTPEDRDVVAQIVLRRGISWLAILMTSSYQSDEIDAVLMFNRTRFTQRCSDLKTGHLRPSLYWYLYPWRR